MRVLRNSTTHALLVLCILCVYGWLFEKDIVVLKQHEGRQREDEGRSMYLLVDQPSGFDVSGRHLTSQSTPARKTLVFLLRSEHLHDDLTFWSRMATLVRTRKDIGLVGYCDSHRCAESVRALTVSEFPVLVSGETGAIEAVVNADAGGNAILKTVGVTDQSTIEWRSISSTPEKIFSEVTK